MKLSLITLKIVALRKNLTEQNVTIKNVKVEIRDKEFQHFKMEKHHNTATFSDNDIKEHEQELLWNIARSILFNESESKKIIPNDPILLVGLMGADINLNMKNIVFANYFIKQRGIRDMIIYEAWVKYDE